MSRVLVVDDVAENRYLLEALLRGNGHQVESAANGAEALERARRSAPDLIVTDILMPVMDGFALCREWKADEALRRVPFVFYTATYTEPKDEAFALSLGAERFVLKPQKPEELLETLQQVLREAAGGRLGTGLPPREGDRDFLEEYNATLFRKLEKKMADLEQANDRLRQEVEERKRVEQELVFRNSVLATQQEASLDGILVVDEAGRMISFNRRFVEMWGLPPEAVAAGTDERALRAAQELVAAPETFLEKVQRLYAHREETSRDLIGLRDGRFFDRYSAPIRGEQGEYRGRVWYFRDVTEQRRLEEQLRQAQKLEAVGTLAGGVAHDFNNLLSAIMGHAALAARKLGSGHPALGDVDRILAAADRATGLTRSLLAFSRKEPMRVQAVDLNDVVRGFERLMGRLSGEDVELAVDCAAGPLVVEADAGQLEQVLMNLATNARDAMPAGGRLRIGTRAAEGSRERGELPPGPYAVVSVSDTGTGIDPEVGERVFEPFFTTKEAGKGTGLGLAIVYGIVQNHGGLVRFHGGPGGGTTFEVYLPLRAGTAVEATAADQGRLPHGTETVLLVEDSENVRLVTGEMLRELGYQVLEAVDGEDAVRIYRERGDRIDLVLCDLAMPRRSGREALAEIRKIRPGAKAIFTSGYGAEVIAQKGLLEEGVTFLSKPFAMVDLSRTIRQVLDS